MTKRIIRLDASALKESACDYRLNMIVIEGYRDKLPMNDTQYGTAVHKFISMMYLTHGNMMESLKAAKIDFQKPSELREKKDYLTETHFIKTCFDYWQNFLEKDDFELLIDEKAKCWQCKGHGLDKVNSEIRGCNIECAICSGKGTLSSPMVEVTFEIKIYEDEHYIVYLCGTIDKLGKFKNGCYALGDYKTTSSWDIKNYFNQYELSTQLLTYRYAIKKMGEIYPDSLLGHINQFPIGAFIDGVFLKSAKETSFKRSEVYFTDKKHTDGLLQEYEWNLGNIVTNLINDIALNHPPSRNGLTNGACANGYGTSSPNGALCRFFHLCACKDDIARAHVLKNNFAKKEYHPLKFHE